MIPWMVALLLACQPEPAQERAEEPLQPTWARMEMEGEGLRSFYNLQRAIDAGNRPLVRRRALRALETATHTLRAVEDLTGLQPDLAEQLDALRDRIDGLPHLKDWRVEAHAINHAILELHRRVAQRQGLSAS